MNVAVIGSGYVGLVSGACLSISGHKVTCVDKNEKIVETISSGRSLIYEPGLDEIIKSSTLKGTLDATCDLRATVLSADIVLIAVGTPSDETGHIDLKYILQASSEIGEALREKNDYCCIVIKSTVVPGTTMGTVLPILETTSKKNLGSFGLGMNPEFLREGSAVKDFMNPDRIILGGSDNRSFEHMKELYKRFDVPIIMTNPATAELIKYANNTLLAMLISFSNEMSRIADHISGVDVKEVMNGIHLDQRLSPLYCGKRIFPDILKYLAAGCGYGGSCFPKDVNALKLFAEDMGINPFLINAISVINSTQPSYSVALLERLSGDLSHKKVGVLGLAFKQDTDDVRETPAFKIISELLKRNAVVYAHDPLPESRKNFSDIYGKQLKGTWTIVDTFEKIVDESDVLFLITPWKEYIKKDWKSIVNRCPHLKIFFDARGLLNPEIFDKTGCKYYCIGYGGSKE